MGWVILDLFFRSGAHADIGWVGWRRGGGRAREHLEVRKWMLLAYAESIPHSFKPRHEDG